MHRSTDYWTLTPPLCFYVQYGQNVPGAYGPKLKSLELNTDPSIVGGTAVDLHFDLQDRVDAVNGSGSLHFHGTAACTACCNVSPIEINIDGEWFRADVEMLNSTSSLYAVVASQGKGRGSRLNFLTVDVRSMLMVVWCISKVQPYEQ